MAKTNEELLAAFLAAYQASGKRTPRSAVAFRVRKLLEYLAEVGLKVEEVGYKEALAYQLYLKTTPGAKGQIYSAGSLANFMKQALMFFEFLKSQGHISSNAFQDVERVKVAKHLPRVLLKENELAELLAELARFPFEGKDLKRLVSYYRTHLVAELLYATGLRISELAALKVSEIDFKRGFIEVACGKGGKPRLALIGEYALKLLELYLTEIKPLLQERKYYNAERLFGAGGRQLLTVTNAILKEVTARLNFPPISCHTFRHLLGTHLLKAGVDIRHIQVILGHESIEHTEVYAKVDKTDLKRILAKYHPRKLGALQV